jgi:hypothetical protein
VKHALPISYPSGNCVIMSMDRDLLPIVAAQLSPLLEKRLWVESDYQAGYYAIAEVLRQMTACTIAELIQEVRDFRGLKPEFESVDPAERTSVMYNSLNDSFAKLLELRGIMDDGWFTDTYTTLKDVVQVTRGLDQSNATGIWDTVAGFMDGSASAATIATNIGEMLSNTTETAVEAGLLTALVAIEASNAAMLQLQVQLLSTSFGKLDDIVGALRGVTPPDDNILQAIRGDTPADADRNVVELLI